MDGPTDLREVRAETFEPLVGTEFRSRDHEATFVLTQATRLGVQPHAPRREPFSLIFTGRPLPQGTYRLEHTVLGRLELFLVPIESGPDGLIRYEAIFN